MFSVFILIHLNLVMFMTYLYAVPAPTTEEVTDATKLGSTEIGTTETVTTGIYTTEGMIHLRDFRWFIVFEFNLYFLNIVKLLNCLVLF